MQYMNKQIYGCVYIADSYNPAAVILSRKNFFEVRFGINRQQFLRWAEYCISQITDMQKELFKGRQFKAPASAAAIGTIMKLMPYLQ